MVNFISNCVELQGMQNDLAGCYQLLHDIDCSNTTSWNGGDGFAPVGDATTPFTGAFNGDNYKIFDLYISRSTEAYVGLFGYTSSASGIFRTGLERVDVTGNYYVGGFVGYGSLTDISDSQVNGNITGNNQKVGGLIGYNRYGFISNSYSTGSVTGNQHMGGLVGYNEGSILNSYSTGSVTGNQHMGGLVGRNEGSILSSYSTGSVSGTSDCVGGLVGWSNYGSVSNSYSTGSVTGNQHMGGLVGRNEGSILSSYSTGSVSEGGDTGGLVGNNEEGSALSSYYDRDTSGQRDGGKGFGLPTVLMKQQSTFSGWDFSNIWTINQGVDYPRLRWESEQASMPVFIPFPECLLLTPTPVFETPLAVTPTGRFPTPTAPFITPTAPVVTPTGPVVTPTRPIVTLTSIWRTPTGRFVTPTGQFPSPTPKVITPTAPFITPTAPIVTPTAVMVTPTGRVSTPTPEWISPTLSFPTPTPEVSLPPTQKPNLQFISNCIELQGMQNDLAGCYQLLNDIDCSGTRAWNGGEGFKPIGDGTTPFTGAFNGNNFNIFELYISLPEEDYVGLFGYIQSSFGIYKIGIEQASITGHDKVGGLAGYNKGGEILNSYFTGNVTGNGYVGGLAGKQDGSFISDSYFIGSVSGSSSCVGGLVGYQGVSSIMISYSAGNVIGSSSVGGLMGCHDDSSIMISYFTGSVSGDGDVGGLVGHQGVSSIMISYFTGDVRGDNNVGGLVGYSSAGSILNSYSTGSVIGSSNVGGLVGYSNNDSVFSAYYDKNTSGQSDGGKGFGMTTVQMKRQLTFSGWDFSNTWTIDEGIDYPRLRWEEDQFPSALAVVSLPECLLLTPTAPFVTPTAPYVTPTEPYVTPTAPIVTPTVPYVTPTAPYVTPTAPVVTPTAPFVTPTAPYVTPTAPYVTPTAPYVTPTAPYVTPTAPYVTPSVPYVTPTAPYVTPTAPYVTPTAPYVTPTAPYVTPTAPYVTPTAPYVTPSAPYVTLTAPYVTPTAPYVTPTAPYVTPTAPVVTPTAPVVTPTAPVVTPTAPYVTPTAPFITPTVLISTPTAIWDTPTGRFVTPTAPIITPTAPLTTPTAPFVTPTVPIATPTAPVNTPSGKFPTPTPKWNTPTVTFPTPTPEPVVPTLTSAGVPLIISINALNKVEISSPGRMLIVTVALDPNIGSFIQSQGGVSFEYNPESGDLNIEGSIAKINRMFNELRISLIDLDNSNTLAEISTDDGINNLKQKTVAVSHFEINRAPIVDQGIQNQMKIKATRSFVYEVVADAFKDPEGDEISYTFEGLSNWMSYEEKHLFGTPPEDSVGKTYALTLQAADKYGASNSVDFIVKVINKNPQEGKGILDQQIPIGQRYQYAIPQSVFTDADDAVLTYEVFWIQDGTEIYLPVWLNFDGIRLYGTPGVNELDMEYEIKVVGSDGVNDVATSFALSVYNEGPMLQGDIPDMEAVVNWPFDYQFEEDLFIDDTLVTYLAYWLDEQTPRLLVPPFWLSFDPENRRFAGFPNAEDIGTIYTIKLTASDSYSDSHLLFQIKVRDNSPPELIEDLEKQSIHQGTTYTLKIPQGMFNDSDGDPLTFKAKELDKEVLPTWLSLEEDVFSGKPVMDDKGISTIALTAFDEFGGNTTAEFEIDVYITFWDWVVENKDWLSAAFSAILSIIGGFKWGYPFIRNNFVKPFPQKNLEVKLGASESHEVVDKRGQRKPFDDVRMRPSDGRWRGRKPPPQGWITSDPCSTTVIFHPTEQDHLGQWVASAVAAWPGPPVVSVGLVVSQVTVTVVEGEDEEAQAVTNPLASLAGGAEGGDESEFDSAPTTPFHIIQAFNYYNDSEKVDTEDVRISFNST